MTTIFCTKSCPDTLTVARETWGEDAQLGYPGSTDTGPYSPDTHEVVGYVAAHRTGPRVPVVRRREAATA